MNSAAKSSVGRRLHPTNAEVPFQCAFAREDDQAVAMPDCLVSRAEQALGFALPDELRRVYTEGDGRWRPDGQWWVVWPVDRLIEDNKRAWTEGLLASDLVAFGDDGTGNPFCVARNGDDAVVRWSWIDGAVDYTVGSMEEFMAIWVDPNPT